MYPMHLSATYARHLHSTGRLDLCTQTYIHVHKDILSCTYIHAYMQAYKPTIYLHAYINTCLYLHVYLYTQIHMYTQIHAYLHREVD